MATTVVTFAKALARARPHQFMVPCRCISQGTELPFVNRRSGVPKPTTKRNLPLTYEQAGKPEHIGVRKGWNSFNTSNLSGMERHTPELTYQDMLIRKFLYGTFPAMIVSEVVIKRRRNQINLAFLMFHSGAKRFNQSIYFLVGYSEEFLSLFLKCPVKIELQTVQSRDDLVFKRI